MPLIDLIIDWGKPQKNICMVLVARPHPTPSSLVVTIFKSSFFLVAKPLPPPLSLSGRTTKKYNFFEASLGDDDYLL